MLAVFSLSANGYAVVETPYRRDPLRLFAYGAFGTRVLAAVLGLVSGIKRVPVGWLAPLGGAAGATRQFSWAVYDGQGQISRARLIHESRRGPAS